MDIPSDGGILGCLGKTAVVIKTYLQTISGFSYAADRCSGFGTFDDEDFDSKLRVYVNAHYAYLNMLIHEMVHTFQSQNLSDLTDVYIIEGFIDYFARLIGEDVYGGKYGGLYVYNSGVIMVSEMVEKWGLGNVANFAFGKDGAGLKGKIRRYKQKILEFCEEHHWDPIETVGPLKTKAEGILSTVV